MPNYARITLIGHACGDPETRQVNDKAVANFTVAVNDPFGPKGNDGKPIAVFYKVAVWDRRLVDVATKYIKKGDAVMVEGRLSMETYETRDGQKRTDPKVSANDIVLLGGNKRDDSAPQGDNQERRSAPRTQPPADTRHAASDDLPF